MKVLIVDDERIALLELVNACKRQGMDVKGVSSPHEATLLAKSFKPHVLITDLHLKGATSGAQLIRSLSSQMPNLRTVLFSGGDPLTLSSAAQGLRGCKVISKPFSSTDLVRYVQSIGQA
jgi:DNA-binding NarL/FixJ family response regulator